MIRRELLSPGQVATFLEVARSGSYRAAATALGITQPSVSAAVRGLEEHLGLELLARAGRTKRLTPAGETFRGIAAATFEKWAQLDDLLQEALSDEPRGRLRIGAGEAAVLYLLPEAVRRYRRRYPDLEITLFNQRSSESWAMLKDGGIDIAVRSLEAAPKWLSRQRLVRSRRMLITPKGHPLIHEAPLRLRDLQHPFVVPWIGSDSRRLLEDEFRKAGLPLQIGVEAGRWEAIKRYVAAGLGIAVVPEIALRSDHKLSARSADTLFGIETYGVLMVKGGKARRTISEFVDLLAESTQDAQLVSSS